MEAVIADFQLQPSLRFAFINGFAAPVATNQIPQLKADPRVLYVETDGPVSLCAQTNGAGVVRMGVDQFPVARINGITEPLDVDVAVLDTGIDPTHPDLNVHHFFSPFTSDPTDFSDHGTYVACALTALDNDIGTVGVAPGVRLWSIKVHDPEHVAWSYFVSGLAYILQYSNEVEVVNISMGNVQYSGPINSVHLGVRRLVNAGIVVVAGAGNDVRDIAGPDEIFGTEDDFFPAALPQAMAVSAMDATINPDTNLAYDRFWRELEGPIGSNFNQVERTNGYRIGTGSIFETNYVFSPGGAIDVAAPGANILMTRPDGRYVRGSGTSYAAPHVAGLVALYIAANGRATNAAGVYAIRQAIINASLPQSQWATNNTGDPDTNPEPLAIATEAWIPQPHITSYAGAPGNFQLNFAAVPGYAYTAQSAPNLTPPVAWADASPSVLGGSNVQPASVTATNVSEPSYHRLRRSPAP